MKTIKLLISLVFLTLISCNNSDADYTPNTLIETWKYTEMLADPGNGSGVFTPVTSDKTLTFDNAGNVS